uniref:Uncharacterized protein n=1 Tax=Siphoviridae sp. ctqzz19 TaxID=2825682 RepID=A0A8S5U2D3_9CAUD|nr:MAG TPA: hypothetical protein [Siphoviridae sp. ctqzz19]
MPPYTCYHKGFLSFISYAFCSHKFSIAFLTCGLVGILYLFNPYALPLTILCIAFGSDSHFSIPV